MLAMLKRLRLLGVLAGAAPLVTFVSCNQFPGGGGQLIVDSTNDDFAENVLEVFFDDDDVDDFLDDVEDVFDD